MQELISKIQSEIDAARKRSSTNNTFDYVYGYGLEKALDLVNENIALGDVSTATIKMNTETTC